METFIVITFIVLWIYMRRQCTFLPHDWSNDTYVVPYWKRRGRYEVKAEATVQRCLRCDRVREVR